MSDAETDRSDVTITVKTWGPYLVQGSITLKDTEGNVLTPPPAKTPGVVKLCSCGHSRTRPFCDGSHKTCSPPSFALTKSDPGSGPPGAG